MIGISTITAFGLFYSNSPTLDESFHEEAVSEKIKRCWDNINSGRFPYSEYFSTETGEEPAHKTDVFIVLDSPLMDLNNNTAESILTLIPKKLNAIAVACIRNGGLPEYNLSCASKWNQEGNLRFQVNCYGVNSTDIFDKVLESYPLV